MMNLNDERIIRKKIIPIRPLTPTREAIELVVLQRLNDESQLTIPTITEMGHKDTYIESWRFALDYGVAWIVASFYVMEWELLSRQKP